MTFRTLRIWPVVLVFVASGLSSAARLSTIAAQATLHRVVGRVIEAESNQAIVDAIVTLSGSALGFERRGLPRQVQLKTDATGGFSFRDLPEGSYTLEAKAPGYLGAEFGQRSADSSGSLLVIGESTAVVPVTLRLWRASLIEGRVTDDHGDPLSGATVRGLRWETVGGRRRLVPLGVATSDAGGRYRLEGLMPGQYAVWPPSVQVTVESMNDLARLRGLDRSVRDVLSFLAPSRPLTIDGMTFINLGVPLPASTPADHPRVYRAVFWPEAQSPAGATSMTLASGGELRNIDFQVRSSPTVRVSGRISGEVDLATRTAIRLEPADAALISPVTAFETAVATAGADGQFRFDGVVPGSYNLRVLTDPPPDLKQLPRGATMFGGPGIAQSISMPDGTIAPVPLPAEPMRWAILPIVVSDKEIRNLELIVQKGIRLTGKVQFESGSVSIGNVNLQQIELSIESARDTSGGTSSVRGTADKAGVLRSSSLPQGDYYVRTSSLPPGLGLKSVLLGSKDIIEGIVNLDRDRDDLTLILTDRPTRIVGTVVRVNGTPDPDATVVIFPVDQRLWVDYGLHPGRLRAERAAPNGAFQIEGMPIGKYLVAATYESAMEDWRDQTTLSRLSSGAAKVQVDDGGVVRVMLSSKGR